jgi:hypothetical protein
LLWTIDGQYRNRRASEIDPARVSWLIAERTHQMVSRSKFLGFSILCAALLVTFAAPSVVAQSNCITVVPASLQINFPARAINTQSLVQDVVVTNTCATKFNISSFSFGPSAFKLLAGFAPFPLTKGQNMTFEVVFAPTAAQTYTGNFTVNVTGLAPIVVGLSGTGTLPGAVANLSTTSLTFSNVAVGKSSAAQNLVITNTGTKGMTIENVYTDPPFSVTGFSVNQVVKAGGSITLPVTFSPSSAGSYNTSLVVTTNNLPPMGITLYGNSAVPGTLAITNFPNLPPATQGYAYYTPFSSVSGNPPITWSVATGSTLPSGLTLSSTGVLSGTVASTVALGNYPFSVTATDSQSHTATVQYTLAVDKPTGAECNNISWDVAGTSNPMVPLTDLGTGSYLGTEGGLYLNGSNVMPSDHDADGVALAQSIGPLDSNGNPDPTGKFAMLSIGMSIAYDNFQTFTTDVFADPSVNKQLVLVPGAQPRVGAVQWASLIHPAWADIFNYFLPQSGVTPQQVVVAWVEVVDSQPSGTFPADMAGLQSQMVTIAQNLHTEFPSIKMVFFTSREYGAYSNGMGTGTDPEPYAYESAFAVRGMIQDQLNGDANMNYNAANGPVMAPWVAWGPYTWANGLIPRSDGLQWSCQNYENDGVHTSGVGGGTEKVANQLMNFFKTNDATASWFLAPTTSK